MVGQADCTQSKKLKPALTCYRKALLHNKCLIWLFYKYVVLKGDKGSKTGGGGAAVGEKVITIVHLII